MVVLQRLSRMPRWQALMCIVAGCMFVTTALLLLAMTSAGVASNHPLHHAVLATGACVSGLASAFVGNAVLSLLEATQRAQAEADRRAQTDGLTGALNRPRFIALAHDSMTQTRARGQSTSLLLLDVDDFKRVNDRLGHAMGDDVLRGIAQTCLQSLRANDLFARWGGEEFVMLLPATTATTARMIAARLADIVVQPSEASSVLGHALTMTISIASSHDSQESLEALMRRADVSLQAAKRRGRGLIVMASDSDPATPNMASMSPSPPLHSLSASSTWISSDPVPSSAAAGARPPASPDAFF